MATPLTMQEIQNKLQYEMARFDQDIEFRPGSFQAIQCEAIQRVELPGLAVTIGEWTDQEWVEYQVELAITMWENAHRKMRDSQTTSFSSADGQFNARASAAASVAVAKWFGDLIVGRNSIISVEAR